MSLIEPGDRFEIEYGNGRRLTAVALSFRQERSLARMEDAARKASTADEAFELCESALRDVLSHFSEDDFEKLLSTLNLAMIQQILFKINSSCEVSAEEQKKSE